jgi:hypothetical protein
MMGTKEHPEKDWVRVYQEIPSYNKPVGGICTKILEAAAQLDCPVFDGSIRLAGWRRKTTTDREKEQKRAEQEKKRRAEIAADDAKRKALYQAEQARKATANAEALAAQLAAAGYILVKAPTAQKKAKVAT